MHHSFILKCASLSRARRARRAQAHSGGAGPGAPAHSQVDVDGHVQQRQAVAARAASKRPGESSATGGAVGVLSVECTWCFRGWNEDVGPLPGVGVGGAGDGKWDGEEKWDGDDPGAQIGRVLT